MARRYRGSAAVAVVGFIIIGIQTRLQRAEPHPDLVAMNALAYIRSAQVAYAASCGNGGYATTLDVLLAPAGPGQEAFLAESVVAGTGTHPVDDVFTLGPGLGAADGPKDCLGRPTRTKYYASAVPRVFGPTNSRAFAVNADGVIWQVGAPTAPVEPFSAPAKPLR